MSEETAPDSDPAPEPPVTGEVGGGDPPITGGKGAEIGQSAVSSEPLPPRADRDRFGSLGKNVANPDRACLTCAVLILGSILLLVACLVYYYYANPAFHRP